MPIDNIEAAQRSCCEHKKKQEATTGVLTMKDEKNRLRVRKPHSLSCALAWSCFLVLPGLGAGDTGTERRLNEIYTQLRRTLTPAEKEGLKQEELDWLKRRERFSRGTLLKRSPPSKKPVAPQALLRLDRSVVEINLSLGKASIQNQILRPIKRFPISQKSVRIIAFAFFLDGGVPKAAYREVQTIDRLIPDPERFRQREFQDFSFGSNVFWADGGIATFSLLERTK